VRGHRRFFIVGESFVGIFHIAFSLCGEKLVVSAAFLHKLCVGALLRKHAAVDNEYLVRDGCAGKSVGNEDSCLILAESIELVVDLLLRNGVKACRRLIEDEDVGIAVESACYRKLLPLTDGKLQTFLFKNTHKGRIVLRGKVAYKLRARALLCGFLDVILVGLCIYAGEGDVFLNCNGVFTEVLEDDAVEGVKLAQVIFTDIVSIKQDLALCGVIKSCNKLDKGRFSRAVKTDENDCVARFKHGGKVFDNVTLRSGVAEGHVAKLDSVAYVVFYLARRGDKGNDCLFFVHKSDKVIYKERTLVDRRHRCDEGAHTSGDGVERTRIEGVVADEHIAVINAARYIEEKSAIYNSGYYRDGDIEQAFFYKEGFKTLEIFFEDILVSVAEMVVKTEDAKLLRHILVCGKTGVIGKLAAGFGVAAKIVEVLFTVGEADYRAGHRKEDDDKRREGAYRPKDDYVGDHAYERTHNGKRGAKYLDRSVARFA